MSKHRRRHQRYKVSAVRLVSTIMDLPEVEQRIIKTLAKEYRRTIGDVFNLYLHMERNTKETQMILNLTKK